jgi:hypothetical protein
MHECNYYNFIKNKIIWCADTCTVRWHVLLEHESGLTHLLMVNGRSASEEVEFTYNLGNTPGVYLERTRHQDGRDTTRHQLECPQLTFS